MKKKIGFLSPILRGSFSLGLELGAGNLQSEFPSVPALRNHLIPAVQGCLWVCQANCDLFLQTEVTLSCSRLVRETLAVNLPGDFIVGVSVF